MKQIGKPKGPLQLAIVLGYSHQLYLHGSDGHTLSRLSAVISIIEPNSNKTNYTH